MSVPRWTHVVIHHSATPDTPGIETWGFKKYHEEARGWRSIGYHYVVECAGAGYLAIATLRLNLCGIHSPGWNSRALAVCLAGNFSVVPPPLEQGRVAADLVAGLCDQFEIPTEHVLGHRDTKATECPGSMFSMVRFREEVDKHRRLP